ncbi:hypothetical protein ACN23B_29840 (plasmid) [Anabaena sp. FACHB-709]|uniref:Uncharacterized protein n=2 Tax=Nostocaceae TaxID=1162 RepID=A0A1Z4KVZ8_ANAVA|nr:MULTISPECIES: hypothetical protein [Nostocaceae]BAY73042.1 hypothetical protein NIES23_58700 [Trichormus variabilis NIES-23]HBW31272.1 hypothetical protein [Nostoc sp. UBA8866]MBD2173016.1 hypothetical protein [Anabaena cylindrica FACHB-318]MBD2264755.1 hypothetical protein [Anabaena sp. FACHB-709]MBD2273896.1 hypothetical protein [Nostoc sp. PCC 7120 = FACHB-418]
MYVKFAAAIICIALCSLNVVAAVKRTPIRTTLEGSTRTTVEMMPSPNSGVHWMSAVIFMAGFACFLGWGISDYNNAVEETDEVSDNLGNSGNQQLNVGVSNTDIQPSLIPPVAPHGMRFNNEFSAKNVVQFSPRSAVSGLGRVDGNQVVEDGVQNQTGMLSPEEFYAQLQEEDFWEDTNSQINNKPAS